MLRVQSSSATRESNLLLIPGISFWFLVPFGPSLCKSSHCTIGQRCKYPVPGRLFGRSRETIAGYPSMKNAPLRRDRAQPVPYPGEKSEALSYQRDSGGRLIVETHSTGRSNIKGFFQIQFPRGSHTDLQRKMQLGGVSAESKQHSHQGFTGFLVALSSADLRVFSIWACNSKENLLGPNLHFSCLKWTLGINNLIHSYLPELFQRNTSTILVHYSWTPQFRQALASYNINHKQNCFQWESHWTQLREKRNSILVVLGSAT